MTLGAWIFLSVVLILVVLNKPFRKLVLWAAAISAVGCSIVYGYIWVAEWREQRQKAHEAAIQQKRLDDCNVRLNAMSSSNDQMLKAFQQRANANRCLANPNITPEEAALLKPGETLGAPVTLDLSKAQPIAGEGQDQRGPGSMPDSAGPPAVDLSAGMVPKSSTSSHLPPGYKLEEPTRKSAHPTTIEGTVTKDAVLYSESSPAGPEGEVLGKVESGTHVRVIRFDPIYENVLVRTPNGITGWLSRDGIDY